MADGEPTTKKFKHSIISEHILEQEFQDIFCKHWHGRTPFKNSDIEIIAEPFRVCKISNFLNSKDFMEKFKNELVDVKSVRKSTDLYQYEQSEDLSKEGSKNIKILYHAFQTDLANWLQENTKIVLNKEISMSSFCYCDTDFLLCHDDNLGERRIAFVLYLSQNWTKEDGGALDLFDTDEDGLPRNVVKSMIPEYNSLVLFEVVHNSYHQVAEVMSPDKSRWCISGWFHGPLVLPNTVQRPEPVINYVEPENTNVDLSEWISKNYLHPKLTKQIHKQIEKESFAFLSTFLKQSVYERLSQEIQCDDIQWRWVGPADVRNYEVADEDSLPKTLADFCRIFKSISVFELLKKYTELDLVPVAEHMHPRVTLELQRWSSGCYTLIHDRYGNQDNVDTSAGGDKRALESTSNGENEAVLEGESSSPPEAELPSMQNNDVEESEASEENPQELGGESSSPAEAQLLNIQNNYMEQFVASEKNLQEVAGCTPPMSAGDDESEEEEAAAAEVTRRRVKRKSLKKRRSSRQLSPLEAEGNGQRRCYDIGDDLDDPDVSDIGDYLSDSMEFSSEHEDEDEGEDAGSALLPEKPEKLGEPKKLEQPEEPEESGPGSLDLIIQFNTCHLDKRTIDYVDPLEVDAALIHVPCKDNHLCLVYRTGRVCSVHRYVNHYVQGYFYNLVCTYHE